MNGKKDELFYMEIHLSKAISEMVMFETAMLTVVAITEMYYNRCRQKQ